MGPSDGLGTPGESTQLGSSGGHALRVASLLHGTEKEDPRDMVDQSPGWQ